MATETPPAPPEASATALKQCRYGRMLYLRGDVYIGRSLELYGEYGQSENALFAQLLAPGHIAVEVGANIGAHTVHLGKLVGPGGAVLAFEPQRIIFTVLCANLALNDLFNARPIHAAVGSSEGTINVPVLDPRAQQNFGGLSLGKTSQGEPVSQVMLDRYPLPSLRLLKLDVEGMETEVLLGARQTIAQHRPFLYVENDRRDKSTGLIRLIEELGYRSYWHLAPLFNPANFAGHAENVFGGVVSINMISLPNESPVSITGFRPVAGPDDWWEDHTAR
jgi:FkbM family methyltransferase